MKINIIRGILIILLAGTFYMIFGFSSQNSEESTGVSMRVSETIINFTRKSESADIKYKLAKSIEPIIRKLAHFSVYTLVGFLIMSLVSTYKLALKKRIIISMVSGFLYACSDEIHQLFVSGRSGEIRDILIDTSGVLLGTLISLGIISLLKKHKDKKQENEKTNEN